MEKLGVFDPMVGPVEKIDHVLQQKYMPSLFGGQQGEYLFHAGGLLTSTLLTLLLVPVLYRMFTRNNHA